MPWLEAFKLALIKENEKELLLLLDSLPQFSNENEMIQAKILIKQAIDYFQMLENEATIEMQKIHKAKKYLDS